MKKRAALSIIFLFLPLILLLSIAGCSSKDDSAAGITGNVIKDVTAEPVGTQGSAGAEPDDSSFDVACTADSDCGDSTVGDPACFQGNVLVLKTDYTCKYPGTPQSYCSAVKKESMIQCNKAIEKCSGGKCLEFDDLPCLDSDGGKNPKIAGKVIDAENNEIPDECWNDTLLKEKYCENGKGRVKSADIECEELCSSGKCITNAEKYNLD